ncbi:MAG: hypothetical protein GDA50_02070 [Alphaproteobacteria bacterium GM202ARS2]|nr:hypothetical protein [Alphaproteobacteria bacterium GM202ARS2]
MGIQKLIASVIPMIAAFLAAYNIELSAEQLALIQGVLTSIAVYYVPNKA